MSRERVGKSSDKKRDFYLIPHLFVLLSTQILQIIFNPFISFRFFFLYE